MYEVRGVRPRLLLLPSRHDWDPACGCPAYPEDLDTDDWFTSGQVVSPVHHFPGTRCRLANGYDIISARGRKRAVKNAPLNGTLQQLFSVEWSGTLVVVKRASRHSGRAVHITSPEVSLINAVVERYAAEFLVLFSANLSFFADGYTPSLVLKRCVYSMRKHISFVPCFCKSDKARGAFPCSPRSHPHISS